MNRKPIVFALALALVLLMLAPGLSAFASETPVTLKVVYGFADFEKPFETLIANYTAEHPNVKIELISGAVGEILPAMIQQRDYPNISLIPDGFDGIYAQQGLLLDLSDRPVVARTTPANLATHTVDGKVYAISTGAGYYGIYYNKALFAQAGIEAAPTTLSELKQAVDKLNAAGIAPFIGGFKDNWPQGQYFRYGSAGVFELNAPLCEQIAAGTRRFSDADVKSLFDGPMELIDLIVGNLYEGSLSMTTGEAEVKFGEGEGAMYMLGDWSMATMESGNPKAAERDVTGFMPILVSDNEADNRYLVFYNAGHGIFKDAPHLEEAIAFYDYVFSHDGNEIIAKGTGNPGPFTDSDLSWANEFKQDIIAAGQDPANVWTDFEYLKLPSMVAGLNSSVDGYMRGAYGRDAMFDELQKAVDTALAAQ